MSNWTLDESWAGVLDIVGANLKEGETIMAPDELSQVFPQTSPYSSSNSQTSDDFSWVIIHKGRTNQIKAEFLKDISISLNPVYASEVFVVFAKTEDLPQVDPNNVDLEAFLDEAGLPLPTNRNQVIPLTSEAVEARLDQYWKATIGFIKQHAKPGDRFLLPDEISEIFPNTFTYDKSYTETFDSLNWIMIHKGRLLDFAWEFLMNVFKAKNPVFANEVFVLYSSHPEIPKMDPKSPHLEALRASILDVKKSQSPTWWDDFKATVKGTITERNKITVLTRQRNPLYRLFYRNSDPEYIPLSWAATSPTCEYANLGDALSPVLVSALSGILCVHENFESRKERMACVGTIGHGLKNGIVHFWGTGTDTKRHPVNRNLRHHGTRFFIHSLRGPLSARTFQHQGVHVPDVYGDPVWFLPSIMEPAKEKKYELGVIVHLSELTNLTDKATVPDRFLRYQIPEELQGSIKIISTITQPTYAALEEKVKEITSCKRIASTSLHGLVIPETYGIPCVYFRTSGGATAFPRLDDESEYINPRMRDFYRGIGMERLYAYGQPRHRHSNWDDIIRSIDENWQPIEWNPEAFLDTFPMPLKFNPLQGKMFDNRELLEKIRL
jgi:hypothetical protein